MPFIQSDFKGNSFSKNGHFETIYPALFRNINVHYQRERIILKDGDFLDLDFLKNENSPVLVLFHGLEGSSDSQYIKGFSKSFFDIGFTTVAVNFRSCSGSLNNKLRSYHSGATDDIDEVLQFISNRLPQSDLYALGFSLGGNALLKYTCDLEHLLPKNLKKVAAISVPIDLAASSKALETFSNKVYMQRFLKSLNNKMKEKEKQFPGTISTKGIEKIKTFHEWDSEFTAPIHGFKDSKDYYEKCNALQFLQQAPIPTLLLNAANDPFLAKSCFPKTISEQSDLFHFMFSDFGGHVGFAYSKANGTYEHERRIHEFFGTQKRIN
jgi:predicted alpha/beta-fold hydrolase